MKTKSILPFAAAFPAVLMLALFCGGCAVFAGGGTDGKADAAAEMPEATADAVACGDRMLAAIRDSDYQEFVANLSPAMRKELTMNDFESSNRQLSDKFGRITDFHYLVNLKAPEVDNLVWTVTFEQTGSEKQTIVRQLLFRVVAGRLDGKVEVFSFGFF
ncbi:MAG: hypothetical protein PHI85_10790 [Victivallaceae bacterium]|nr:hypothetical protein [Victivallaceae bacterium]